MSKQTMLGNALPNIPWEDRPAGSNEVVWRFSQNPIIPGDLLPNSNSIFNSAVVPYQGKFAGVFRCDNRAREMRIHSGRSEVGPGSPGIEVRGNPRGVDHQAVRQQPQRGHCQRSVGFRQRLALRYLDQRLSARLHAVAIRHLALGR